MRPSRSSAIYRPSLFRDALCMKTNMRASLCLLTLLIQLCIAKTGGAQERMRIAWAGSTPSNTPIWVADQKGFFKKNGLNAEVISINNTVRSLLDPAALGRVLRGGCQTLYPQRRGCRGPGRPRSPAGAS